MQDGWYSDSRDVVKWAALAHLVQRESLRAVVQVAMFRSSMRPTLESSGLQFPVPDGVWSHFRSLKDISRLGRSMGCEIVVIDEPFSARVRSAYFKEIAGRLRLKAGPKAVLLDPDTGFEPRRPNAKHITVQDARTVWESLLEGDWLLVYQHRWRDSAWRERAVEKFNAACGVSSSEAFRASKQPSDVILLAARRSGTSAGSQGAGAP